MRAVIQRVQNASIRVEGKTIASIGKGILVLAGLQKTDQDKDLDYIAAKILGVRIFDDSQGIMNLSVTDILGEIMLVSQFTLYGDARKGKRPSYSNAMDPITARNMFDAFIDRCAALYSKIHVGSFGSDMEISLVNDGPVTILLDSSKVF